MKYPTDDGSFSSVPKEVKQHIFSFLRGSPVLSLVCRSFNEAIDRQNLLPSMQGKIYKIEITLIPFEKHQTDTWYTKLHYNAVADEKLSIIKFCDSLHDKLKQEYIEVRRATSYFHFYDDLTPNFGFSIKKEKLYDFLSYIDELKIKSTDCKIEIPFQEHIENSVKNVCSQM